MEEITNNNSVQLILENFAYQVGDHKIIETKDKVWCITGSTKVMIVGSNGSGKTSFLECIGCIKAYSGAITFAGTPLRHEHVSIMTQIPGNFTRTVKSYIENHFLFKGKSFNAQHAQETFDLVKKYQLPLDEYYDNLSFGQKRIISFICAHQEKPSVLLLDEFSLGIHYDIVEQMKEMLIAYKGLVIASSNDPDIDSKMFSYRSDILPDKTITAPELLHTT